MKNTIIIFLLLCSIKGFSQVPITRTLSNVNNTADSLKPVSVAQKVINTSLQSSIATNASNVSTNTTAIATKLNKAGDIITGDFGNTATGFFRVASGTTAQRPSSPLNGMLRYNTDVLRNEFYSNGNWRTHARLEGDTFTGNIFATNLSGTNTGDETNASIISKLNFNPLSLNNTEKVVFATDLSSYTNPDIGNGALSFTRDQDEVSTLLPSGLWGFAPTNVAAYTYSPILGKNRYKSTSTRSNVIGGYNRDLRTPAWIATNTTITFVETGIDGVANSASRLTATGANATVLAAYTIASATRTFSAYVKRVAGGGRIWITRNGGTTWKDITGQLLESGYTRVFITSAVTNPTVGFRMETSGDAIAVDCTNDIEVNYLGDPYIVRSNIGNSNLTINNIDPIEPGYIYALKFKIKLTGDNFASVTVGDIPVNSISARFPTVAKNMNVLSFRNSVQQYNNTGNVNTLLYNGYEINVGEEMEIMLVWGNTTVKLYKNNVLVSVYDYPPLRDPLTMSKVMITGECEVSDLTISRLPANNLLLFGDSITALPFYAQMFHTKLSHKDVAAVMRGISGNTITDLSNRYIADIVPAIVANNKNTCVLWIGTNTLAANVSASTALSQLTTLISQLKGVGVNKVVCVTTLKRGDVFQNGATASSFEVQRLLYNAGLRNAGADDVVDLDASGIVGLSDPANILYFDASKVHPKKSIYEQIFPLIVQKL